MMRVIVAGHVVQTVPQKDFRLRDGRVGGQVCKKLARTSHKLKIGRVCTCVVGNLQRAFYGSCIQ